MNNSVGLELEANREIAPTNNDLIISLIKPYRKVNEEMIFIIKRIIKEKPTHNICLNLLLIFSLLQINRISESALSKSLSKINTIKNEESFDISNIKAIASLLAGFKN